jgi:signal transduction histidine kinase
MNDSGVQHSGLSPAGKYAGREGVIGATAGAAADAAESRLRELTHDLVERIKELNCLYGISRLVEREGTSLDAVLQGVVDLIPPAWQYPDVTCARIRLKSREFRTRNFRETQWRQAEAIIVNARRAGTVEVFYTGERPFAFEGPFLKEERDLIHGIAERLGHIVESKKAEAKLQRLYARERRLRKRLQVEMQGRVDFTRQLMHELKTPLTSLLATSQLLTEETRNTRLNKLAGYVWEGASSLNSRIDELHDVIRGETGRLKLDRQPLNMEDLLAAFVDETKPLSAQYGVSIVADINGSPLPEVMADPVRIRQVMFNLINNACQYASSGKRIDIKARHDMLSGAVAVEVRDYGPGIPKDKLKHLFKPGYQAPQRDDLPGGLGIGLTLCKMLVELHGGSINVESTPGEGAGFFFTLPTANQLATSRR